MSRSLMASSRPLLLPSRDTLRVGAHQAARFSPPSASLHRGYRFPKLPKPSEAQPFSYDRHCPSRTVFQTRAKGKGNREEKSEDEEEEIIREVQPEPVIEDTPVPPKQKPTRKNRYLVSYGFNGMDAEGREKKSVIEEKEKENNPDAEEEEAVAPWREDRAGDIRFLKTSLLSTVAGYDRGFAAVAKDTASIRSLVESLETLSGSIDLTGEKKAKPDAQELFDGTWKLVFTSAFNAGKRRPRLASTPLTFGPVYQVVDTQKKELDNVVELLFSSGPRFPWTPSNAVPKIRLTLKHEMSYSMSIVSLTFKETEIAVLDAGFDIPKFTLPSISDLVRSLTGQRSDGEFSLVYLDEDLRITEGDRSELRIFVKTVNLK